MNFQFTEHLQRSNTIEENERGSQKFSIEFGNAPIIQVVGNCLPSNILSVGMVAVLNIIYAFMRHFIMITMLPLAPSQSE